MAVIKTVWAAYTTSNEYGAIESLIGVASTRALAETFAEKRGWWGSQGAIKEHKALTVSGKTYLLADSAHGIKQPIKLDVDLLGGEKSKLTTREKEIKKAKAKLTTREKELLGVK